MTAAGGRGWMLIGKFRRGRRRVDALRDAPRISTGVPFAQYGVWERARRGVMFGLVMPGIFTVLIGIAYLINGRYLHSKSDPLDLLVLVITYPLGSVIAGSVIASALPRMTTFARAALVSSVALVPLCAGIGLSIDGGLQHWGVFDTIFTAGLPIVLGLALANGMRRGRARAARAHVARVE